MNLWSQYPDRLNLLQKGNLSRIILCLEEETNGMTTNALFRKLGENGGMGKGTFLKLMQELAKNNIIKKERDKNRVLIKLTGFHNKLDQINRMNLDELSWWKEQLTEVAKSTKDLPDGEKVEVYNWLVAETQVKLYEEFGYVMLFIFGFKLSPEARTDLLIRLLMPWIALCADHLEQYYP